MKSSKQYLYLREDEYHLLLHTLLKVKNKLHREGGYTDAVDELLIKISKAKENPYCIIQGNCKLILQQKEFFSTPSALTIF